MSDVGDFHGNDIFYDVERTNGSIENMTKRDYFLEEFPKQFELRKNSYEKLRNMSLMQSLKVDAKGIKFQNSGKLTTQDVNYFQNQWEQLMYMGDSYFDLAMDLAIYTYHKGGFGFGPATFAHLIPSEVKKRIPEYIDRMYNIMS